MVMLYWLAACAAYLDPLTAPATPAPPERPCSKDERAMVSKSIDEAIEPTADAFSKSSKSAKALALAAAASAYSSIASIHPPAVEIGAMRSPDGIPEPKAALVGILALDSKSI